MWPELAWWIYTPGVTVLDEGGRLASGFDCYSCDGKCVLCTMGSICYKNLSLVSPSPSVCWPSHARAEQTLGRAVTQFALPQVVCPVQGQITSRLHRKQLYELHLAFRRGWVLWMVTVLLSVTRTSMTLALMVRIEVRPLDVYNQ